VLGVDDGPVLKHVPGATTPIVGVMMEGPDLVEAVAVTRFAVDGADATDFLAGWIASLRFRPSLQAVVFGGITIAGLGIVDIRALSERLALPVISVNRRRPSNPPLNAALRAAGLAERIATLEAAPPSRPSAGLFASAAGASRSEIDALLAAVIGKSGLPEPLRVAHLVARALEAGESRGKP
jgi:endonuclease V-like protein UPF0215 family